MAAQVYYEDVEAGGEVPSLVMVPTTMQLVKFAGASGDYHQIHYDQDYARSVGLPGVIVHGWLTLSFLGRMVTDWMGDEGNLVKLSGSYRGMNFPGEDIICRGKIARKYAEDGRRLVRLEIWAEKPAGDRTTTGSAVVELPSRV